MVRSDTKQFRNLSYLEGPSSAFQCLDELHGITPFLANEGIGGPISSKARPGCSRCLILLCLGVIANTYRGPDRAGGDSAHRPPLAHVPARGQTFLAWPLPSTPASTNQEKSFRPSGESHSGLVPVPVRRNQPSYTERTKKMNSESIKKVTNQAIEQLVEALNAGHSEALMRYLAAMPKFIAHSFLNVLLMLKQFPNAGRVAGYRTWQSFGRQVKQGAKGIMILAPMFRKRTETTDESNTTDKAQKPAGFGAVYVGDDQPKPGHEPQPIDSQT